MKSHPGACILLPGCPPPETDFQGGKKWHVPELYQPAQDSSLPHELGGRDKDYGGSTGVLY